MTCVRDELTAAEWAQLAGEAAPPLLALWADTRGVYALLQAEPVPRLVSTPVDDGGGYPALSPVRPVASPYERMVHDLWGHVAVGAVDLRPLLDHGAWPHTSPMALRPAAASRGEPPEFAALEGFDQIPIGPVRGGIAAAAHLRLAVRGEIIVRAEAHLGYAHKGQLTLMRGKSPRAAARFAARLAGEATVAHAIAFARAAEDATGSEVPPRAQALRGVMAEIERIATHLDVLAAMAEAAGVALAATWCARHVEALRRAAGLAFGHRLMMDCVIPGGVAVDLAPGSESAIIRAVAALAAELPDQARGAFVGGLRGIGCVTAARAAHIPGARVGDADARMQDRLREIGDSARLIRNRVAALPEGPVSMPLTLDSGEGIGFAAGPDGDIWHWLRLDHGQIASVFMRDPAWSNWQLVQAVLAGAALDDLPVVLASFGLIGPGADL